MSCASKAEECSAKAYVVCNSLGFPTDKNGLA